MFILKEFIQAKILLSYAISFFINEYKLLLKS